MSKFSTLRAVKTVKLSNKKKLSLTQHRRTDLSGPNEFEFTYIT